MDILREFALGYIVARAHPHGIAFRTAPPQPKVRYCRRVAVFRGKHGTVAPARQYRLVHCLDLADDGGDRRLCGGDRDAVSAAAKLYGTADARSQSLSPPCILGCGCGNGRHDVFDAWSLGLPAALLRDSACARSSSNRDHADAASCRNGDRSHCQWLSVVSLRPLQTLRSAGRISGSRRTDIPLRIHRHWG